jgi:hypothetical protein
VQTANRKAKDHSPLIAGKVRVRTVSVCPRRGGGGTVVLMLGKKRLRGAFVTYEDRKMFPSTN